MTTPTFATVVFARSVAFAQATRFAGAEQCSAKSPLHPPKGANVLLGAARRRTQ